MTDLLDALPRPALEAIRPGVALLPRFVEAEALVDDLVAVLDRAPLRRMQVPGGGTMSVAMSNCGEVGWVTDRRGYRYAEADPLTGRRWPAMPESLRHLAANAAEGAGFPGFAPDACLINAYIPGSRLGLHRDEDEADFSHPIVSVSLGVPAIFLLGGLARTDPQERLRLTDGDTLVFGGAARLIHHGIAKLEAGAHPLFGASRINLTFRKAT